MRYNAGLSDSDRAAIKADRLAGMPLKDVAAKYNVAISTVSMLASDRYNKGKRLPQTSVTACRHCLWRKMASGKRGLCVACYVVPSIRELYEPEYMHDDTSELTEEELEQMIAEQLPTMPREPKDYPPNSRLPVAVLRGRGVMAFAGKIRAM